MERIPLAFERISARLHGMTFPPVDGVVGILRGGLVPALLIAHQLGGLPVHLLAIAHRDDANQPLPGGPRFAAPPAPPPWPAGARLLLVDDVSVSGRTLALARSVLAGHAVTTCALKGHADLVAFPEISGCVRWPWADA